MAERVSCWGSCTSGGRVGWVGRVGRHSRRGGRGACRSRETSAGPHASACEHTVRVCLALQPAGREASVRGVPEVLGLSSPLSVSGRKKKAVRLHHGASSPSFSWGLGGEPAVAVSHLVGCFLQKG